MDHIQRGLGFLGVCELDDIDKSELAPSGGGRGQEEPLSLRAGRR